MTLRSYELQLPVGGQGEVGLAASLAPRRASARSRCPTLVVVGPRTSRTSLEIADVLATAIPGARLATIEGAGHLPSLERPDELNRLLLDFLR